MAGELIAALHFPDGKAPELVCFVCEKYNFPVVFYTQFMNGLYDSITTIARPVSNNIIMACYNSTLLHFVLKDLQFFSSAFI